ncbi:MAG: hypothetical protein AAGK21_02785 [Bacteroidota bacterium]
MAYRPTLDETMARFAEAWSTPDADARWSLVHAAATADVVYYEPGQGRPIEGQAALAAFLGLEWEQHGRPFRVVGSIEGHHHRFLVPIALGEERGLMVVRADRDNRIVEAIRFAG